MAAYRTHMKIIGEILETTQEDLQDGNGASVTYLIRKANISHSRISGILSTLVSQGLLEQTAGGGANKYKISQSGREFLRAYYAFTRFADSFGLSI
ncbi:MAG: transcriptional regulator [Nitrosopumilus sp. H13]|nr:MAG: transcriptional regulator [Nitrosopumilus sp. H13]